MAAMGAAAWIVLFAVGAFREIGEALVALAIACAVPLGSELSADRDDAGKDRPLFKVYVAWLPFGIALGIASFFAPVGAFSAICASAWFIATLLAAMSAIARILRRGLLPHEELSIDVGHLYLPVGAIWLIASRAGYSLLGFHEPIVLYTANHFHYAGFAAPVLVGLLGRELAFRRAPFDSTRQPIAGPRIGIAHKIATTFVLAGVPLVAAGIVVSHALELPAAAVLGTAMLVVACLSLVAAKPRLSRGRIVALSGALIAFSGLSLIVSMAFALTFAATGSATRGSSSPVIPYATMAAVHGVANAVGFALLGFLAYSLEAPPRRSGPYRGTWPRLFGRGFIGIDFFDRSGAVDESREVQGQLADLSRFGNASFSPERVHPEVRAFYESTKDFELHAAPEWHHPFRLGGRAFAWFGRRLLGQLELPIRPERGESVSTRLFAVRDDLDGRTDVRGYVRAYGEGRDARANYVGAYSTHQSKDRLLLSCAFPLPYCALLGVLRFEDGDTSGGIVLSSRPPNGEGPADEGMFLVTRIGPIRLPIDERLSVAAKEDGSIAAEHAVRVLGLRAFTLHYTVTRKP